MYCGFRKRIIKEQPHKYELKNGYFHLIWVHLRSKPSSFLLIKMQKLLKPTQQNLRGLLTDNALYFVHLLSSSMRVEYRYLTVWLSMIGRNHSPFLLYALSRTASEK